jgi:hypothetical protein
VWCSSSSLRRSPLRHSANSWQRRTPARAVARGAVAVYSAAWNYPNVRECRSDR